MTEEEREIQKYIDEKRELQKLVIEIIDQSEEAPDASYEKIISFLDMHHYENNKSELKHFLNMILSITNNHHRNQYFFTKIEHILSISSKYYKPIFSNVELFDIFQESKPILVILLKSKIIAIDEIIFKNLFGFTENKGKTIYYYFYPELKSIIKSGLIQGINEEKYPIQMNDDIELFERNRQSFENESELCSIIRGDLIDDFIAYIQKTNISLSSQIERSILETNAIFNENEPKIIEYATFYGSIQIVKYLNNNNVKLTPSLWLYAVHSNQTEILKFLEEKQIKIDDGAFSEAVKCHHNEIVKYISEKQSKNIKNLDEKSISSIYSSSNYEFFSSEIDGNNVFFSLYQNEYNEIVNLYLKSKSKEIENYIKQNEKLGIPQITFKALSENKLDVAYHLLLQLNSIPKMYFGEQKLTKIALPPTIKSIGQLSFVKCSSLTQIIIPPSVNSIGETAFYGCSALTQITFLTPSSITSIGKGAFYSCSSLKEITIPSSVTSIGDYVFSNCSELIKITIPSSVTSIGEGVFCKCSLIKQIAIPPSVTSIGEGAFSYCLTLDNVTIPSSIKSIKKGLFYSCSSLKNITIQSSVTSIGESVFSVCFQLEHIEIPSSVTSIGKSVFENCFSLKQVTIPSSINRNYLDIPSSAKIITI